MIPRVGRRGDDVVSALRYLFGPGDRGEHVEPHLVAAWALSTIGGVHELEPPVLPSGGRSVTRLARLLEQPVAAGLRPPARPLWQCSLHNHPDDPVLTDAQWATAAAALVDGVGLAPAGDVAAARWVAVRHGADHIHVVATAVRQDRRTAWLRWDYTRCQQVARRLEVELGLHRVTGRSGAASMCEVSDAGTVDGLLGLAVGAGG